MLESNAQSAAAQSYESYGHQQQNHHFDQSNESPTGSSAGGIGYNEIKIEEHLGGHRPTINQHHSSNVVINNVYGGSLDDDSINTVDSQNNENYLNSASEDPELFFVDNDSVSVSSPSPEYGSSPSTSSYFPSSTFSNRPISDAEMYLPPSSTIMVAQPHQELPTRIPTGPYDVSSIGASGSENGFTPEHFGIVSDAILNSQSTDFTHSGITHPGVDAVIIGEDNTAYGGSSISIPSSTERLTSTSTETDMYPSSTEQVHKVTYAKPAFRPKPTKKPSNGDKYVLVQTINHDSPIKTETLAKPQGTMSDNDIESIESIILMLNDTKTGPQYNTGSSTEAAYDHSSAGSTYTGSAQASFSIYGTQGTAQPSTSNIDYEKYGPSSYYITTKLPATNPAELPSTSYVFNPQPTRRPISVQSTIASSYGAVSPEINSDHLHVPSSSLSPPVNDHVAITKRPVILTAASFATTTIKPSTNYVYISTPTRRPISADDIVVSSTTKEPTTTNKKTKRPNTKIPTTRLPSTSFVTGPTTPRPKKTTAATKSPSTSFVYTSTATRQPTTRPTNKINNRKNATNDFPTIMLRPAYGDYPTSTPQENIAYEHVIQSKPLGQQPYVQISTENPSPTVHITPKPTVNLVTSSTWTQQPSLINRYTTPIIKSPSTSYIFSPVSTMRPGGGASATPIFSSGYGSSITYSSSPANKNPDTSDFDDPGYYGISSTHRPSTAPQAVTASSVYTVYDPTAPVFPGFYGSTPSFGPEVIEYSTLKDEFYTSPNDYNNFPPVRNPNLNISSGAAGGAMDEYDISTPAFVEDEALNDKMGLLVSKIVESLSGNFEQLADVVYDDTVVQADPIATSARPATTVKRPTTGAGTTRKPAQRVTSKKPSTNAAKPATTNTKPPSRPSAVTTKRPGGTKVSTAKPANSSQNPKRTTKKPPTTLNATKKPAVTKVSICMNFAITDLLNTKHITVTNNPPTDRETHKEGHANNDCSTGRSCRGR